MFRKITVLLLVIAMVFSLAACGGSEPAEEPAEGSEEPAEGEEPAESANENWKIGIATGTVSQNEEEYRAAEQVQEKYGEEHVIIQTYPDKFMDEQETVIANIVGMASDPDVKAIIAVQAIPGTVAAFEKVREMRGDDILLISGTVAEDPAMASSRNDIALQIDELGMGPALIEQIKKQGAETFIHYSFPRHMSYALLAARRDIWKELSAEEGIEFVEVDAPDPTGDAGVSGAQQFILEDVPKQVEKYGKNTAFFSTNCSMQPPLIKAVYEEGAIYPQPCCPSPYHGFPSALQIEIPEEHQGDTEWMIEQIRDKMAEKGMTGRMSTWPVPMAMSFLRSGADYAVKWINGEVDRFDLEALKQVMYEDTGVEMQFTPLEQDGVVYDNYIMVLSDYVDF
jgi:predicted small lipoprotein YifL